jgi:hypothetical protein
MAKSPLTARIRSANQLDPFTRLGPGGPSLNPRLVRVLWFGDSQPEADLSRSNCFTRVMKRYAMTVLIAYS